MKIKAGKFYFDRIGNLVGPMEPNSNMTADGPNRDKYPWMGVCDGITETYTDKGLYFQHMREKHSLVRKAFKLKEDRYYYLSDGSIVGPMEKDRDCWTCPQGGLYDAFGRSRDNNIVAKVPVGERRDTLRIAKNGVYYNAAGEVRGPMRPNDGQYPWRDVRTGETFYHDGSFIEASSPHDCDLIRPVPTMVNLP